ncbi:MAG: hypothetical protein AABZ60_17925 [Planctomycetota bacterium]
MLWIPIIILFLAGVLGSSGLIIAKKPDAKDLIAKLAPFQGIIGVLCLFWGLYALVGVISNMGTGVSVIALISTVLMIVLGALLGFGLIKTFLKEDAAAKLNEKLIKVAPFQGILGVVAIALAIWSLISVLRTPSV